MKRIKARQTQSRKITRTGDYTYYVTIPKEELESLGWRERERVTVKRVGKKLIIEKVKKSNRRKL